MMRRLPAPGALASMSSALHSAAWIGLSLSLTMLAACTGSLLPKPSPLAARFTLDADSRTALTQSEFAGTLVLKVNLPRSAPGFQSRHIVYLRQPGQLEAFAFHEWVDTPAQMLAPVIVRALQSSGGFRAVLAAQSPGVGDWQLETDMLRLEQDFTVQPSQVRLSLRALLINSATRKTVAWREFDLSVPAAGDDPVAGVLAAQAATQRTAAAIAAFCAQQSLQ